MSVSSRSGQRLSVRQRFPILSGLLLCSAVAAFAFANWFVSGPDLPARITRPIVNDVTQLNPVSVARIVFPRSVEEVRAIVRDSERPIAVGGGHYSMGGQTASEGCISLDMRKLDGVLELDLAHKRVRVQAGITWRKLQAAIDPHDLSVSIMQTYSNFTVGGALSVNAHGRYVGGGPVIGSVEAFELVLADGSLVLASRDENAELFFGAIGGYGGLGVIVTATLRLADNERIQRHTMPMPVDEYAAFFAKQVRGDPSAVFHNADLYPPSYDFVRSQTWSVTGLPLTEPAHFIEPKPPSALTRALLYWVTELPLGRQVRQYVYDPIVLADDPVVLRNHEASYDVIELEPGSRAESTYVLQEYFVPVEKFDAFVPKLRDVLTRHDVNAINVSIRHARPDDGSLLAWARSEVFCFVLYYKQGTDAEARRKVGVWTRAAIDAVLSVGGAYYLPYQPHATLDQVKKAYPRFDEYAALKRRVDPEYRFRNKLWDTYLPPPDGAARARQKLHAEAAALRNEGQTFLTLPEWYIVFSAEEHAQHMESARPSAFPYFASNGQFWRLYRDVYRRTRHRYPPNFEYHVMNMVIGASFSLENVIKGAYENTVGRVSEWFACDGAWALCNAEDRHAADVASAYDTFIRTYPWYEFPYRESLRKLWHLDTSSNQSWIRTVERRLFLSLEYGIKTLYAAAIRRASQTAFGVEELKSVVWLERSSTQPLPKGAKSLARYGDEEVALLPRYEGFRDAALELAQRGIALREVAGNDHIALTVVTPRGFRFALPETELTARWPVLTRPSHERALLFMPVSRLGPALTELVAQGAVIDHVFDY